MDDLGKERQVVAEAIEAIGGLEWKNVTAGSYGSQPSSSREACRRVVEECAILSRRLRPLLRMAHSQRGRLRFFTSYRTYMTSQRTEHHILVVSQALSAKTVSFFWHPLGSRETPPKGVSRRAT